MSLRETIERIQRMRDEEALAEGDDLTLPEPEFERRWVQQETFACLDVLQLQAYRIEPAQGAPPA
ncbi:MAG TPA: hypothetical protein VIJ70_03880 [Gaiellaceae bacterium]